MENWVPLFNIFLNSPTPESEASRWFHESFSACSSPITITTNSFLSLLTRPATESSILSANPSLLTNPDSSWGVMWIQTLPSFVQSRILSFLAYEHHRFSTQDLVDLATTLLDSARDLDFWVAKGARNLLGKLSHSTGELNSRSDAFSSSSSSCCLINEQFYSLPTWLKGSESGGANDDVSGLVLPWLSVAVDDELRLDDTVLWGCFDGHEPLIENSQDDENSDVVMESIDENPKGHVDPSSPESDSFDAEIQNTVKILNARLLKLEVASETAELASEICHLCLDRTRRKGDSLAILELIEPWRADDNIIVVLLSHLLAHLGDEDDKGGSNNNDEEEEVDGWPSQVLCSTILPKLLFLDSPASRVLMNLTIDYCKLYQRAAEYALLLPLIHRKEAINTHIADVMIRIIKDCLHPTHVGAFCHKLLCVGDNRRRFMCLSCHQSLISTDELLWCEPMFSLFQNILNKNVHLTQESVDCLVHKVNQLAEDFSTSLKFGNFLLSFVIKCFLQLKHHKGVIIETASRTNTLVTKAILVKLSSL